MDGMKLWLRRIGRWGTLAFGVLASLFIAGYAWEEPGGWVGVGQTMIWIVPMLMSMAFARWRPDSAWLLLRPLVLIVVAGSVVSVIWAAQWSAFADVNGPFFTIYLVGVSMALAVWARFRPREAGRLLLVTGLIPLVADVVARYELGGRVAGSSSQDWVSYAALAGGFLIALGARGTTDG